MNPNETLRLAREAAVAAKIYSAKDPYDEAGIMCTHEAAEHYANLDSWLSQGGILPDEWREARQSSWIKA